MAYFKMSHYFINHIRNGEGMGIFISNSMSTLLSHFRFTYDKVNSLTSVEQSEVNTQNDHKLKDAFNRHAVQGSPMGMKRGLTIKVKPVVSVRKSESKEQRNPAKNKQGERDLISKSFKKTDSRTNTFYDEKKLSIKKSYSKTVNVESNIQPKLGPRKTRGSMTQVEQPSFENKMVSAVDKIASTVEKKNSKQATSKVRVIQVKEHKQSVHQVLVLPKVSIQKSTLTSWASKSQTTIQHGEPTQKYWVPNNSHPRQFSNNLHDAQEKSKRIRNTGMVTQTKDPLASTTRANRNKSDNLQRFSNRNNSKVSLSKAVDFRHNSRERWTMNRAGRLSSTVEPAEKWNRYSRYLSNAQ